MPLAQWEADNGKQAMGVKAMGDNGGALADNGRQGEAMGSECFIRFQIRSATGWKAMGSLAEAIGGHGRPWEAMGGNGQ